MTLAEPGRRDNLDPMIHVTVPEELESQVADLSDDSRRSLDQRLREAIEQYLWDQKHGEIALQKLADIDAGRSKTISMGEMKARLGLVD